MAKIWPVRDGRFPTHGAPWAEMPLSEAIDRMEISAEGFVGEPDRPPRFGDTGRDLTWTGFKHVVVEIDLDEANNENWKPGFYRSPVSPKEAFRRLIEYATEPVFKPDQLVRVDYRTTLDSQDSQAIEILIVLTPSAIDDLAEGDVLDSLNGIRKRLREMGEDRTPIIDFATEAELATNAGA